MRLRRGTPDADILSGSVTQDLLLGMAGNDVLLGGPGKDILIGGAGNDRLDGGPGIDSLGGDAGNDTYVVDDASEIDPLRADPGHDLVLSNVDYRLGPAQEDLVLSGSDALRGEGNESANRIAGNSGANFIVGGAGNDHLSGAAGDDRLEGGAGNDVLQGGAGRDRLSGGAGDDRLVYDARDFAIDGGRGYDILFMARGSLDPRHGTRIIKGIEEIDLSGPGAAHLSLDADAVLAMHAGRKPLLVRGDEDDALSLEGRWTPVSRVDLVTYRFQSDGVMIDVSKSLRLTTDSIFNLSTLNGDNGYRLFHEAFGSPYQANTAGRSIATAGDFNGDGFDDFIIGSPFGVHGSSTGVIYVVFGGAAGHSAVVDFDDIDGSIGFRIEGSPDSYAGLSIAGGGDINRDGFDDLIISTDGVASQDSQALSPGASIVLFGAAGGFPSLLSLADLEPGDGARFDGGGLIRAAGSESAIVGDSNGDGFDDFLISAVRVEDSSGNGARPSAYLVFGHDSAFALDNDLDALAAGAGLRLDANLLNSDDLGGASTFALAAAGDVNGDGLADVILGAAYATAGHVGSGIAYVVFGQTTRAGDSMDLDAMSAQDGWLIRDDASHSKLGGNVASAGDFNGDGFDDIVLTATTQPVAGASTGVAYVLFGQLGNSALVHDLRTLDGANGFRIDGFADDGERLEVSSAGDVNGDGYDDLLLGAPFADPPGDVFRYAGSSYLVFGSDTGFGARFALNDLDGRRGFRLDGSGGFESGYALSAAGDLNGDGYDDFVIGSFGAGGGHVIFGRDFTATVTREGGAGDDELLGTSGAESLVAGRGNDVLDGAGGADVLRGGAGDDVLVWHAGLRDVDGGSGNDTLRVSGADISIDLTLIAHNKLKGVEVIDLSGNGDNHLRLSVLEVLAMSEHGSLRIDGNAGDSVESLGQGWTLAGGGPVATDGQSYNRYDFGAARLLIDTDVTQTIA